MRKVHAVCFQQVIQEFVFTGCLYTAIILKCESGNNVFHDVFISWLCLHSVHMQVKVNNEVATGTGPNKKVAKRNAAEAMLLQLGYKASTVPQNPTEVRTLLLL